MTNYQDRVRRWTEDCFEVEISKDKIERNYRFFEEATELVQSLGMTKEECIKLIEYTFSRPSGNPLQEVGGTMTTLAALCNANEMDMIICGKVELNRCYDNIEKIRRKQKDKRKLMGNSLPL